MIVERMQRLSVISTYFHVALGVIGSVVFFTLLAMVSIRDKEPVNDYEDSDVIMRCYFVALLLYFLLMVAFSIVLIVGIGKRRPQLMVPFVYLVYGGTWIYGLLAFRHFIVGLWYKGPLGKLFVTLIINLMCVAIQAAIFCPVYMLYRRWKSCPPTKFEDQLAPPKIQHKHRSHAKQVEKY